MSVDVNHSSTGVISEERGIARDAIDPQNYGNDEPVVFEVAGTAEGSVEKVVATVTVIRSLVAQLDEKGEIDDRSARTLTLHLTAVELYEKQGTTEKIIKHMEGIKLLIEQQEKNNLISTEGYNQLKTAADSLILSTKWK